MYQIEKKSAVKGAFILGNGLNHFSYNKFTLKRLSLTKSEIDS